MGEYEWICEQKHLVDHELRTIIQLNASPETGNVRQDYRQMKREIQTEREREKERQT